MGVSDRLRILVVEDEFLIAIDLADVLAEFGHDVCGIARTADEAYSAAERFRPDVVLTDIRLAEGSSGVDAAKRIRAEFGIRSCFLSGSIDNELMAEARSSGPIGFVSKPFHPQALRSMLSQAAAARA